MEETFLKGILLNLLQDKGNIRISFDVENTTLQRLAKERCFQILFQIKQILTNDAFDDFAAIEKILELLKDLDRIYCPSHDFG